MLTIPQLCQFHSREPWFRRTSVTVRTTGRLPSVFPCIPGIWPSLTSIRLGNIPWNSLPARDSWFGQI
uniref:Uncharacterized protein n=1 Tax=Anguilla anguilla TaxID=7936 RepID=A0A0E9UPY5_ANGAN